VTTDASGAVTGSTWEVAVYRNAEASTGSTTSFPYSSDAVSVSTLSFDADGQLTSATDTDIVDPVTGVAAPRRVPTAGRTWPRSAHR
ncbi:flagellar basal body FlgE domain-containing protein, partial [Rhizobium ruizarguesonis]